MKKPTPPHITAVDARFISQNIMKRYKRGLTNPHPRKVLLATWKMLADQYADYADALDKYERKRHDRST